MVVTTASTIITGNPSSPVSAVTTWPIADNSETMYKKSVRSVKALRYSAVASPYRWRVHSVRTNPSGHFRRMMGVRKAKIRIGAAEEMAYTMTPWRPASVASWGYENRMPDPMAETVRIEGQQERTLERGGGRPKRQHISHASINLIE